MSAPLHVRPATIGDAGAIAAFNQSMARETEDLRLDEARLARGVACVLAAEGDRERWDGIDRGRYLVAERDGAVVGALLVTREWSDWRAGWYHWIQSVYTHPEHRRSGVYRALWDAVVAEARERDDVCAVRLYVERDNRAARQTYEALGMSPSAYQMYELELD